MEEEIFHIGDETGIRVYSFNVNFIEEEIINEIGEVKNIVIGDIVGEPHKTVLLYSENKTIAIIPNTIYYGDPLMDIVFLSKELKIDWPYVDVDVNCRIKSIYADSHNVSIEFHKYNTKEYIYLNCSLNQIDITDEDNYSDYNLIFVPIIGIGHEWVKCNRENV